MDPEKINFILIKKLKMKEYESQAFLSSNYVLCV